MKQDRARAGALLRDLVYLVRDLGVLVHPYLPATSAKILAFLGIDHPELASLRRLSGVGRLEEPALLFRRLEDEEIEGFRRKFSGTQAERAAGPQESAALQGFRSRVELKIARITAVEKHPQADKLYIERIDLGGETRQIVSGLVQHYTPEQLTGHNVIVVTNLKAARLRGVDSQGMLLAAQDGKTVEVLFADHAQPGDRVLAQGAVEAASAPAAALPEISIDEFFAVPITVKDHRVLVEGVPLACAGEPLGTRQVKDGQVR